MGMAKQFLIFTILNLIDLKHENINNMICLQELENHHLDKARTMLKTMQLKPQIRQQLPLLLSRQHLEEQELRLRHWMELEKFQKNLGEL